MPYIPPTRVYSPRLLYERILLTIFAIIIGAYCVYNFSPLLIGPKITVISPYDGEDVIESTFEVTGSVIRGNQIRINGREISVDVNGFFSERLVSLSPYTIIHIQAIDAYGTVTEKRIRVSHVALPEEPTPDTQEETVETKPKDTHASTSALTN